MDRRRFLAASLAGSAVALTGDALATAAPASSGTREFYQLRRYRLRAGPQTTLTGRYFSDALIPALGRMGLGPAGAFQLEIGPETPEYFLLIPGNDLQALVELDLRLAQDSQFVAAAGRFWNAPATSPSFDRIDVSLLQAFKGWPRLVRPQASAEAHRIFQLRTYESPSHQDHVRKIEMFHSGEFDIFRNAGCHPVFFADTLVGSRMPSLTYMLSFSDLGELNAKWDVFRNDPAWKKLSAMPRYDFEAIVSNISNQVLSPLAGSQL